MIVNNVHNYVGGKSKKITIRILKILVNNVHNYARGKSRKITIMIMKIRVK